MTAQNPSTGRPWQTQLDQALEAARRNGTATMQVPGGRQTLSEVGAAVRDADADLTVRVAGLTADTLAVCARPVCDLVVELGVPVQFEHEGRILQLAVASPTSRER